LKSWNYSISSICMENNNNNTPPSTELVKQFNVNLQTKLNDTRSKLQQAVTIDNFSSATKAHIRHTSISPLTLEKVWIEKKLCEAFELSDPQDNEFFENAIKPDSSIIVTFALGLNRTIDKSIIDAALGTTKVGEDGKGSSELPDSQRIIIDQTPTFFKEFFTQLENAEKLLDYKNVPQEDRYLIVPRKIAASVSDMKTIHPIVSNLLPISNGKRSCILFHKSAIRGAVDSVTTFMDIRCDLAGARMIHSTIKRGFARIDDYSVVEIQIPE